MKKIFTLILCIISVNVFAETELEKLVVVLDWFPNPDHAPLVIAQSQGFFKEEGLDVKLIGPVDPSDAPKWVAAGKADIGITYEPSLMEQIDHGLPLISIGSLIDKPLDCVVALKESGIKSIEDLKGKRIGSDSTGLMNFMLKSMLAKKGMSSKDVNLVTVRYNVAQALLSHQVDAVTGVMRNFEVPQLELLNHKTVAFFPEEHGVPNYSVLVFMTHLKNIHDKRFIRFLAAIRKAVSYLDLHPEETWQQFVKQYPESNNEVNREAWFATMPYFAEDPGFFDEQEWARFAKYMKENQLIKTIQPISRYAVTLRE